MKFKKGTGQIAAFAILAVIFLSIAGMIYIFINQDRATVPEAATRDPYLWPFDKYSPWNVPIGSKANYVDAQINMSGKFMDVEGELIFLDPNAPQRTLYAGSGGGEEWWPGAACNAGLTNRGSILVPDNYVVPNPTNGGEDGTLPNRGGGALLPDKKTIQEFQYATRCSGTGPVTAGAFRTTYDIYGSGIPGGFGAHGGSGLTGVGGSLRRWEVNGSEPIRHALKMTVNVNVLSNCNQGRRWPAIWSDGGYNDSGSDNYYGGSVCDFRMGSLTAIHKDVNCQTFVSTALGKRICQALQDYGAYIVDTGPKHWGAMVILGEYGTASTLRGAGDDIEKIFDNLYVIANNNPDTPGGCAISDTSCARRGAGFAPDFGATIPSPGASTAPSPVATQQPIVTPTPSTGSTSGSIEAESMRINSGYVNSSGNIFNDSSASGGKGLSLLSNGNASGSVNASFNTVKVRARADICNGAPIMVVKVDNTVVMTRQVSSTSWVDVVVGGLNYGVGTHTIAVEFTNDHNPGNCDRNLRLDKVSVETAAPAANRCDLNKDGVLNSSDQGLLGSNYAKTGASIYDLNGDLIVNSGDQAILAQGISRYPTKTQYCY